MNLKKNLSRLVLLGTSAFVLSATSSYAVTGVITGVTVRMRENPTTSSKIIRDLDEDNKVEVLEKEGDWYKVTYKGDEGYVKEDYIKLKGELESSKVEEVVENEKTEEKVIENEEVQTPISSVSTQEQTVAIDSTQKVTKDTKLYSLPLISSKSISGVKKDSEAMVLQVLNNWIYVTCENQNGWILKQDLTQTETKQEKVTESTDSKVEETEEKTTTQETSTPAVEEKTKVGYINVENANVRKKPSTDSDHVDTLTLNKEVTILGEEDNWYKIKFGKKEGYIYKKLVSSEKVVKENTSRASTTERTAQKEEVFDEKVETSVVESSNTDGVTGSKIIEYAKTFLGCKYVSGGNGPSSFDCSGFTKYVYQHFGYDLARTSGGQAGNGTKVERDNLQLGDIVVFLNDGKSQIGHVGIYIGNNTFIHAANAKRGVVTDSLSSSYYDPRYVTARRII